MTIITKIYKPQIEIDTLLQFTFPILQIIWSTQNILNESLRWQKLNDNYIIFFSMYMQLKGDCSSCKCIILEFEEAI